MAVPATLSPPLQPDTPLTADFACLSLSAAVHPSVTVFDPNGQPSLPPIAKLPPELLDLVFFNLPAPLRRKGALALMWALGPRSRYSIDRRHLWEYLSVTSETELRQLWERVLFAPGAARLHRAIDDQSDDEDTFRRRQERQFVRGFEITSRKLDPNLMVNLLEAFPRLNTLRLHVGPLFAPEHLEDLFATPRPELRKLVLHFNPYLNRRSYYVFLKGSYFDTALDRLSRWPVSPNLTHLSIVQDIPPSQLTYPPSDIHQPHPEAKALPFAKFNPYTSTLPKTFAQPIVFFKLFECIPRLISAPVARYVTHMRLRVPSRDVLTGLSAPGALPRLRFLDISTSLVRLDNVTVVNSSHLSALLRRHSLLRHLVMDHTGVLGKTGSRDRQVENASTLGKMIASIGVAKANAAATALSSEVATPPRPPSLPPSPNLAEADAGEEDRGSGSDEGSGDEAGSRRTPHDGQEAGSSPGPPDDPAGTPIRKRRGRSGYASSAHFLLGGSSRQRAGRASRSSLHGTPATSAATGRAGSGPGDPLPPQILVLPSASTLRSVCVGHIDVVQSPSASACLSPWSSAPSTAVTTPFSTLPNTPSVTPFTSTTPVGTRPGSPSLGMSAIRQEDMNRTPSAGAGQEMDWDEADGADLASSMSSLGPIRPLAEELQQAFEAGWQEGINRVLEVGRMKVDTWERMEKSMSRWQSAAASGHGHAIGSAKGKGKASASKQSKPREVRVYRFPTPQEQEAYLATNPLPFDALSAYQPYRGSLTSNFPNLPPDCLPDPTHPPFGYVIPVLHPPSAWNDELAHEALESRCVMCAVPDCGNEGVDRDKVFLDGVELAAAAGEDFASAMRAKEDNGKGKEGEEARGDEVAGGSEAGGADPDGEFASRSDRRRRKQNAERKEPLGEEEAWGGNVGDRWEEGHEVGCGHAEGRMEWPVF